VRLTDEQIDKADEWLKQFRHFATSGHQIVADEITDKAFFLLFLAPTLVTEVREYRLQHGNSKSGK
jgi:hypothetical protein